MAANFANIQSNDFAPHISARLGAAVATVIVVLAMAVVTMPAPVQVDETGFEATATAE